MRRLSPALCGLLWGALQAMLGCASGQQPLTPANCSAGQYATSATATACIGCPAGTFSSGVGPIMACTQCGAGTYQPCFLLVLDWSNRVLRQVNMVTGHTTTVVGNKAGTSVDGFGLAAGLVNPGGGISASADGSVVHFFDFSACVLKRLNMQTLQVVTVLGAPNQCTTEVMGAGSAARMNHPNFLAVSGDGAFAIVQGVGKFLYLNMSTYQLRLWVGSGLHQTTDGVGTAASITGIPLGGAVLTPDGRRLYFTNANLIRMVDVPTRTVSTIAGTGTAGTVDGIGTSASVRSPGVLAMHPTGTYLAMVSNYAIRTLNFSTWAIVTIAGQANNAGSANGVGFDATFGWIRAIVFAPDGSRLFVFTEGVGIRVVWTGSRVVEHLTTTGGYSHIDGPGSVATFNNIWGAVGLCSIGATQCLACPAGQYGTGSGAAACVGCGPGAYSTASAAVDAGACLRCGGGTYSTAPTGAGAGACLSCGGGTFSSDAGVTTCLSCGAGTFSSGAGATACPACPAGTYATGSGADACVPCGPGRFSTALGAQSPGACAVCEAGGYQPCQLLVGDFSNRLIRQTDAETGFTTTLAGNVSNTAGASVDGFGLNASFTNPGFGLAVSSDGSYALVNDACVIKQIFLHTARVVSRVGLAGACTAPDGVGTAARLGHGRNLALASDDSFALVTEGSWQRLRRLNLNTWALTTVAGSTANTAPLDGIGLAARFTGIWANSLVMLANRTRAYLGDGAFIRTVALANIHVTTLVGNGTVAVVDGVGRAACVGNGPMALHPLGGFLVFAQVSFNVIRRVDLATLAVTTVAGRAGVSGWEDGVGTAATFNSMQSIAFNADGSKLYVGSHTVGIRVITVADWRAGHLTWRDNAFGYADGVATNALFNNVRALALRCATGATACVPCGAGTFGTAAGALTPAACAACPAGRYCPAGSPSPLVCPLGTYNATTGLATAAEACGAPCPAGSYCPDPGLRYPCPANTASPPGSASQIGCACDEGWSCLYNRAMTVTLQLGVTAAEWMANPDMQARTIAAVAAAAGVPASSVQVMGVVPLSAAGGPGRRRLDDGAGATVTLHAEGAEGFEGLEERLAEAHPRLRGARAVWRHGSRVRALHAPEE
jgi:hypothetical protein